MLGFISDIHRVRTTLEDPVDVRNKPQQGTRPQAVSSSNFLCEFELSLRFSFSFEKNLTCNLFLFGYIIVSANHNLICNKKSGVTL